MGLKSRCNSQSPAIGIRWVCSSNSKGEILSTSIAHRYLIVRDTSAVLNYLHIDLAVAAVVLSFVLIGGLANNLGFGQSIAGTLPDISASTEPGPARSAVAANRPLTPTMDAVLGFVAQRYRVAPEPLLPVFEAAQAAASERGIDPLLIVAVIAIESGFNPFAQSNMGAQGLMQIIPRYHQDKAPKTSAGSAFLDPVSNVKMGAHILQESIRRQGGLMEGLQYYAGASDDIEQSYANKVIAEKLRLEQAARRREAAST